MNGVNYMLPESDTDSYTGKRKIKGKQNVTNFKKGRDEEQLYPGEKLIKKVHNHMNVKLISLMIGYEGLGKI